MGSVKRLTPLFFRSFNELLAALEKAECSFQHAISEHAKSHSECQAVAGSLQRAVSARSALASDTSSLLLAVSVSCGDGGGVGGKG